MKDRLITFETAKLAKDKGFIEKCLMATYTTETDINYKIPQVCLSYPSNSHLSGMVSLPTQSLLQRWLRVIHNIHIWIIPLSLTSYEYYYFKDGGYTLCKHNDYTSYEEALEQGLLQGLKLIL